MRPCQAYSGVAVAWGRETRIVVGVLVGEEVGVTVGKGVEVGVGVSVEVDVGVRVGVFVDVDVNEAEDEAVFGPSSSNKDTPHDPVTHNTSKTKIASGKISFLNMNFIICSNSTYQVKDIRLYRKLTVSSTHAQKICVYEPIKAVAWIMSICKLKGGLQSAN